MAQITRTSHGDGFGVAEPADFARFQEAEQLHLDVLVEFAEFVEEERAAVGDFEQALVVAVGAGERALAVAEQFALDQVRRSAPQLTGTNGMSARLLF